MATNITKANHRREALRRRLDTRYPPLADQLYRQDIQRHRAYYAGQPVPAPTPRRRPVTAPAGRFTRQC